MTVPSPEGAADPAGTDPAPVPPPVGARRCGRCQQPFAGDPDLFFQTDWALCPSCEQILLPRHPAGRPTRGP